MDAGRTAPGGRSVDGVKVLLLEDDVELGAAGAILRMLADGKRVGILDLTSGEPTPHGSLEIRAKETAAATKVLGIPWRENLGLPNRSLEATLEEAEVKRSIAAASSSVVVAIDASKLDARAAAVGLDWDVIDVLVTDLDPDERRLDPFRRLARIV